MPYYLIEINVGISDKLSDYIKTTYSGPTNNIKVFERANNYTKIIAFANSQTAINAALNDIRTHIVDVTEITYDPGTG